MYDFCFKVEIFKIWKKGIKDLCQCSSKPGLNLFKKSFQAPGKVTDDVKRKGEDRAEYGCGEAGEEHCNRSYKTEFHEDEEDSDKHSPFNLECVKKNNYQKD